jgi:hypothetical protein
MNTIPDTQELATTKASVTSVTTPVLTDANYITVTDQASLSTADLYLKRIRDARSGVNEKLDPIIRPVYEGLQALYALKRELSDPLDLAERELKHKMTDFHMAQRRAEELERHKVEEETRRLSELAQAEVAKSQDTGLSAIERARAKVKAKQAVVEAVTVAQPVVIPVRATNSSFIPTEKWEITNLKEFLKGIIDGTIPEEMVSVHAVNMNAMWRMNKGKVKGWPGVRMVEGGRVAGR